MRVFVTGATGFIGSRVTRNLIAAGHQVIGLARSTAGAEKLRQAGAQAQHGSIDDIDTLNAAVSGADGVIHLAFKHDFAHFVQNCEDDRRVVEAIGSTLSGSDRPFVVTSGTGIANSAAGQAAQEDGPIISAQTFPRAATEEAVASIEAEGVNVSVVRLPQVHDTTRFGFITTLIATAREKGVAAYVGDGQNRWPAAHVTDVARLYGLALERAARHSRYHAVAEEGIRVRDIAETIGERLRMPVISIAPEEAPAHFGWLAMVAGLDMPASSAQTRAALGWQPDGPGMLADLSRFEIAG